MGSTDEILLDRALELAAGGRGWVEPNPLVGCVLVKNGHVIGEGYHQRFGGPHAEAEALASCTDSPAGATAYVNLEPCSHANKKTPPCAPRLIAAEIKRVVIGCEDPNPAVRGRGIAQLRAAGVEVAVGVRELQSRQLNAAFFARQIHGRPYVTLKWAESADGKVAGRDGGPLPISNEPSNRIIHGLRSRCDAILVGINTALRDDPLLTVRGISAQTTRVLRRIVLDTRARIPLNARLVATARQAPVHVFVSSSVAEDFSSARRVDALREHGVHVEKIDSASGGLLPLEEIVSRLAAELDVTHLLVEGGPTIHAAFLRQNLADRVWVIRASKNVGEIDAPAAAVVPADCARTGLESVDEDALSEYLNAGSPVFFAPIPSVDLRLAGRAENQ